MWLWLWIVFMLLLFVIPLAYGWGFKGWGPPTRQGARDVGTGQHEASDWGWLATFLWLVALLGVTWLVLVLIFF